MDINLTYGYCSTIIIFSFQWILRFVKDGPVVGCTHPSTKPKRMNINHTSLVKLKRNKELNPSSSKGGSTRPPSKVFTR